MRIALSGVLNRKRGEYKIDVTLTIGRDEASKLSIEQAVELGALAYANASAQHQHRVEGARKAGRPLPKYVHVESLDTAHIPTEMTDALSELAAQARASRPLPEQEEVRTMLRAALMRRYTELGIVPPSDTMTAMQRRLHIIARGNFKT